MMAVHNTQLKRHMARGFDLWLRLQTPTEYAKAISFFDKAIELDPDIGQAHAFFAKIYGFTHNTKWDVHLDIEYQAAGRAEYHLAEAFVVSAEILLAQGNNQAALAEIDSALVLAPISADSYISRAHILAMSGHAEEAETNSRLAMRLNSENGTDTIRQLGRALFYQKRHAEAAEVLERAVSRRPDLEFYYTRLTATYGHLGHYLSGLRKAGVPEGGANNVASIESSELLSRIPGAANIHPSDFSGKQLTSLAKKDTEVIFYGGGEDCSLSPR